MTVEWTCSNKNRKRKFELEKFTEIKIKNTEKYKKNSVKIAAKKSKSLKKLLKLLKLIKKPSKYYKLVIKNPKNW